MLNINIIMFKTITIKKDVYRNLSKVKRPSESFSQLFVRLLREKKPSLKEFYGAWELEPGEEKRLVAALKKFRGEFEDARFG